MNKKEFIEKVWTEVFGCGNNRMDFDRQCLADTCVDGRKVTCDCVSCGEDGVRLHDATESEDMGWFLISGDADIDEDSMDNVLCSINFAVFSGKDGTDGEKSTSASPWTLVSTFLPDAEPGRKMSPAVDVRFKDGSTGRDRFDWEFQRWDVCKEGEIVAWRYVYDSPKC